MSNIKHNITAYMISVSITIISSYCYGSANVLSIFPLFLPLFIIISFMIPNKILINLGFYKKETSFIISSFFFLIFIMIFFGGYEINDRVIFSLQERQGMADFLWVLAGLSSVAVASSVAKFKCLIQKEQA